jgi:hypothetical protein
VFDMVPYSDAQDECLRPLSVAARACAIGTGGVVSSDSNVSTAKKGCSGLVASMPSVR